MEPVNKGTSRAALAVVGSGSAVRTTRSVSQDRLMDEFRSLITDSEQLIQSLSEASGDSLASARDQFVDRIEQARRVCVDTERAVRARADRVAETTASYVTEHPFRAVGIAAAIGLAVGVLMQRR